MGMLSMPAAAQPPLAKPSSAWRAGYLLYDGWPAQEGGTDSHHHPLQARRTRDLLSPGVVVADVPLEPAPPASTWPARYPAWWTESPKPATGAPTLPTPPGPPAYVVDLPYAPAPPAPSPVWQPEPPPPPPPAPAMATATTQTPSGRLPTVHSPLMACMRRTKPIAAPATSRVGERLRRDVAYRNQLASARRRRLEAVVAGAHPDEAPIATVPPPRAAELGRWHPAVGPSAKPSAAEKEAAAALAIAQRFLSTTLGGHFVNSATGAGPARGFDVHEEAPPPYERALSSAAAARFGLHDAREEPLTALEDEAAVTLPPPVANHGGSSATAARGGWPVRGAPAEEAAAETAEAAEAEAVDVEAAWGDVAAAEAAAACATPISPSLQVRTQSAAARPPTGRIGEPSLAAASGRAARRAPATAWEVDVSELRKPSPASSATALPTRAEELRAAQAAANAPPPPRSSAALRASLRPRPPPAARRSHADWVGDYSDSKPHRAVTSEGGGAAVGSGIPQPTSSLELDRDPVLQLMAGLENSAAGHAVRASSESWWDTPLPEPGEGRPR